MDAQELRNLQEAYNQVHQVDEAQDDNVAQKLSNMRRVMNVEKSSGNAKKAQALQKKMNILRAKNPTNESYDLYDIILSHLLDEGYADTNKAALAIMANMSEEWKQSIVEADSVEAMRARAAKRRQQRYKGGPGGRDDFRPYTQADYDKPKPGYGSGEAKNDA